MTPPSLASRAATAACLCLALAAPATAGPVVLTFDAAPAPGACTNVDGGTANMQCTGDGQWVAVDYGSTPELAITYLPSNSDASFKTDLISASDLGIKAVGNTTTGPFAQIMFTPAPGYEVSFTSLNYFRLSSTTAPGIFQLLDEGNAVVFNQSTPSPGLLNPTLLVNSAYYAGPLTFQWKSQSGGLGIDDIAVDVRPVSTTVPETTNTLPLALAGLTALTVLRRRIAI